MTTTKKDVKRVPGEIYQDHFHPSRGTWRIMTTRGAWPDSFKTKRGAEDFRVELKKRDPAALALWIEDVFSRSFYADLGAGIHIRVTYTKENDVWGYKVSCGTRSFTALEPDVEQAKKKGLVLAERAITRAISTLNALKGVR